jgi:hypothetical protein
VDTCTNSVMAASLAVGVEPVSGAGELRSAATSAAVAKPRVRKPLDVPYCKQTCLLLIRTSAGLVRLVIP